ncbi:hypothetical protein EYZ11_003857 [Aspergillus tanneri]|uniref:Uncharacterized protein n=1 Tax=Aspergillus tanneri TaxID=1220188 RepID=A0A4S3JM82_9EURO|nr:hypothetical protein EYZ11_003857 [Aspergillus tanneri]
MPQQDLQILFLALTSAASPAPWLNIY